MTERCFARGDGGPHEPRYYRLTELMPAGRGLECVYCGMELKSRVDLAHGQSHPGDTTNEIEWGGGVGWPE